MMTQEKLLKKILRAATIKATSLNLSNKGIISLPPEICLLTSLEELDLSHNKLTKLPREIGQLVKLATLHLYNNKLNTIPSELSQLKNLQMLKLDGNQLTTVPASLGKLKKLWGLYLYNNKLSSIPRELGNLKGLQYLNVFNNKLTSIPSELSLLTKLRYLNISFNQLTSLPIELGQLKKLDNLKLYNNPLSFPPPDIVEQGTEAILSFLREQAEEGGTRQWVSKLLLVGEGGVGKTSLLRKLCGEEMLVDEPTTHGIQIRDVKLPHPDETNVEMQLKAWDFGGQEIYHATHQFFLTNRSLFLLVWNARHGVTQDKVYEWLDMIKSRAPESPILIVAAWTDERDADIPIRDLMKKYPQIKGHIEVSNKSGEGVAELKEVIQSEAAALPLMGEVWPTNWLNAAIAIRKDQRKHIRPDELWRIMKEHNVDLDKGMILANWLHELGDILFYQDDPEINDLVILKPQWVTEYISKVLEDDQVINELGIFTKDLMNKIWTDLEPEMRDHFLRLMERFDLSYRTLENREISIVVERLNQDPPDYEQKWKDKQCEGGCKEISMRFQLQSAMPAGVPTYFIARTHRFSTHTHWRNGALFADNKKQDHLGLIRAFPNERYLELCARGPMPYNYFALLRDGLELTLDRFPGLKIDRKLPCPGHNGKPCDYEFELKNLENALQMDPPVELVQCQRTYQMVPVTEILFGLHWSTESAVIAKIDEYERARREDAAELKSLLQREFAKSFHREQSKIESHCPNVFVLQPKERGKWAEKLIGQKMILQLYCAEPGCWHPTAAGGHYEIDVPPGWLQTVSPLLKRVTQLLKYAAPLAGPWVGMQFPEYADKFKERIKLMQELIKKLPDSKLARDVELVGDIGDRRLKEDIVGAPLRAIRELLHEKDPKHDWGGLQKVLTPEGDYLWLCEHHAKQYRI